MAKKVTPLTNIQVKQAKPFEKEYINKKAEPPAAARGRITSTYLYMDDTYARSNMSKSQKQLMNAWDKMYPVSEWECTRAKKKASIQKNKNEIVESRCKER